MEATQILEINLISAQGLKPPSTNLRRMQTYAVAWVDPASKLRTRIDRLGGENPTWNDKFLFRVSQEFISCETSAVSVEILAAGYLKDVLIGTVRFLISNCLKKTITSANGLVDTGNVTPAFTAVQIRRPSGRFHGVLNLAVAVHDSADFSIFDSSSAMSLRDLVGEDEKGSKNRRQGRLRRIGSKRSEQSSCGESCDLSSLDLSDGADSTTSSSSTASNALKDWNFVREMAGNNDDSKSKSKSKSNGPGLLCGLMLQRKIRFCPSDPNLKFWADSFDERP